jgi:ABC-type uncharacterized transport system ATPase subunit
MSFLLEMNDIYKTYPNGVRALRGANLAVQTGEIHALIGENAAGKTTLVQILYGTHRPDHGQIIYKENNVTIRRPSDAIELGIGMVPQHFKLVPEFTLLENIILGSEKNYTRKTLRIDYDKAHDDVSRLLAKLDIELELNRRADEVSIGIQSKVEIVKTLFKGAELIILDEPTTVIAPTEIDSFFDFLESLRQSGCTIIYISHRLREIMRLTDRVTVMQKGETVGTLRTSDATVEQLASLMLGREPLPFAYNLPHTDHHTSREGIVPTLDVESLKITSGHCPLSDITFSVFPGEIVGVAGIEGNGQVELADSLIGVIKKTEGTVLLAGDDISDLPPSVRREKGMAYVPDDRMIKGVALDASIAENALVGHEHNEQFTYGGRKRIRQNRHDFNQNIAQDYRVEGFSSFNQPARSLSGGNIQKLIVGREMYGRPKIVVLSQPTAGVDFSAQRNIHERILECKKAGTAFLLISEDIDELLRLSDRLLVLYRGRLIKEYETCEGIDDQELGQYMTGVRTSET